MLLLHTATSKNGSNCLRDPKLAPVSIILFLLSSTLLGPTIAEPVAQNGRIDPSLLEYFSTPPLPTRPLSLVADQMTPGMDIQVTSDPANMPQNEPSIATNPANTSIIVAGANDYRLAAQGGDAWAGLYISRDSGQTWSNSLIPGYPGGPASPLTGYGVASDPALAFDRQGPLYYSGIVFNRTPSGGATDGTVFVTKTTNLGTSFQTVIVARGSSNTFNDKSYIAVDTNSSSPFSGRVYVSWTQFRTTTGKILFSSSSNGGSTFSTPITLSDSSLNQGSVPAVGPGGLVYVAWRDITNNRVKAAKSTNGGVSFSTPVVVARVAPIPNPLPGSSFRTNTNPTIAVDPGSGAVYVAWNDYARGNADILLSRSTNNGSTFSTPVRINDDTGSNDQFFPWLATVPGRVSAVFYDRRLDPSNHNMDVFYTDSTNEGVSFSQNLRVTDISLSPDVQFQGRFIGDYIGLALTQTDAFPAWADTRNQNQDIFTDRTIVVQVHDVAVREILVPRRIGYSQIQSNPLNITVTVRNNGNTAENVTVELSLNGIVQAAHTSTVPAGATGLVLLQVASQTLAKGTYTLVARAVPVAGETNTADNEMISGTVEIRFPGDVDANGRVNILDASLIAFVFGKTCSTPGYQEAADLTNDCIINILDMAAMALYYGQVDP